MSGTTTFGTAARSASPAEVALLSGGPAAAAAEWQRLFELAAADAAVMTASGRWVMGRPDPDRYVPGDVVALRSVTVSADLVLARRHLELAASGSLAPEAAEVAARRMAMSLTDIARLYGAVPHFVDAEAAAGLVASHPPGPDVLDELRLPYPTIAVYLGRPLPLPPEACEWPPAFDTHADLDGRPTDAPTCLGELRARGGGVEGVVLAERPGGGLDDEVLWILGANPDPTRPWPACHDRLRAAVWGRLSDARLAHVATNLAATVAWAEWHEPDRRLSLPPDVGSRAWRKAVRRGEFRRHEPRGGLAGVRVLDLGRSLAAERAGDGPGRSGPTTHLRRAHWRFQRVGPGRTERRLVRVAATVVNPGRAPQGESVYRVPAPSPAPEPEAEPVIDLRTVALPGPPAPPASPELRPATPEVTP
ncbi:MAG: hypothetical protein ACLGIO_03175 [Acidimicrobiia bacterium]